MALSHSKPLNTISVFIFDEHNRILVLQSNENDEYGVVGGWITRDVNKNHSVSQAYDAAMLKICQECGHGDTIEDMRVFFAEYSIDIIDFFIYNKKDYSHAVFFVRWFTGGENIFGIINPIANHKFVTYDELQKMKIRSATRDDMNQFNFYRKIKMIL